MEKVLILDLSKNSVVVMDNAAFHKSQETRCLLENHGHEVEFLPPYSPDLNAIENKWAQARSIRRRENCDVENLFLNHLS